VGCLCARDAVTHNAILSDDYRALRPDRTSHRRKPTAQEIAAAPSDQYSLTHWQAVPIGHDGALVPYTLLVSSGACLSLSHLP
jgi:hypothetical protein